MVSRVHLNTGRDRCVAPYPIYKKSKNNQWILRFTSINTGTVVYCPTMTKSGYHSKGWINHNAKHTWDDLEEADFLLIPKDTLHLDVRSDFD